MIQTKTLKTLAFCFCLLLGIVTPIHGQFSIEEGWYLSLGGSLQSLTGDFDGETILVAPDDVFLVPQVDNGLGVGLKIGYRVERSSLEFNIYRGVHDASWVGATGEAILSLWSLNFQYYFLPKSPFQPFLQLGWSPITPLRVKDGAVQATSMEVSDAIFISKLGNFNAGAGAVYYLSQKVFVQVAALYLNIGYGAIESEEERVAIELEEDLRAQEFHLQFGIAYTF